MRTVFVALLLSLSLTFPVTAKKAPVQPVDIPAIVERVLMSTVRITMPAGDDKTHVCTGFVVDTARGWAMTVAHCLPEKGVEFFVDGQPSELVRSNELLAIVSTERMSKPPLNLRESKPKLGEQLVLAGYGFDSMTVLVRYFSGYQRTNMDDGTTHYLFPKVDNPLVPGMSGGPIVDLNGEIVGIIQASNDALGYGSSAEEIREFLKAKK